MKIFLVYTVLICSVAFCSGTLKFLKTRTRSVPFWPARYSGVHYLRSPEVVRGLLPISYVYSPSVTAYSDHLSTNFITTSPFAVQRIPISPYVKPYNSFASSHITSTSVIASPPPPPPPPPPLPTVYKTSEILTYSEPLIYAEVVPVFNEVLIDKQYVGKTFSNFYHR